MLTATMAEAKTNLSKMARVANETGESVTVMRNSRPWFKIVPLAHEDESAANARARSEADALLADPEHETFDDLQDFFSVVGL